MASKSIVNPSAVREWVRENLDSIEGLPADYTVARQGRLHPAAIAAFNKANPKVKYTVGVHKADTVTVKAFVLNKKGGKTPVTKQVVVSEAREAAVKAGVPVGKRGRVPQSVLAAFATGTLAALVPQETTDSE